VEAIPGIKMAESPAEEKMLHKTVKDVRERTFTVEKTLLF